MDLTTHRHRAKEVASSRSMVPRGVPADVNGNYLKVSDYYGENCFWILKEKSIPSKVQEELKEVAKSGKPLPPEHAELVAKAITDWAIAKGCTHFCHWFQPLTGSTAEKHDAFLSLDDDEPIEKFSKGQLVQGEPDASSFPHGGSRSTFEARGYTAWDMTSPIFIKEGLNGKTLCIPTAFVSYHSDALDIKTPLLRSISVLGTQATKFMKLSGSKDTTQVRATCGAEQEYFLIDKAFYSGRPDLIMAGRTLLGLGTTRNQQLEDHYFGTIPSRVLSFMQDLEIELYKLGIPAKTRHNEVAPGQFEIAPIFSDANVASDQNFLVMAMIREVAERHDFVALLHEKPFGGINGSGKHVNWSMADDLGQNLLEPGSKPEENYRFLTVVSIIMEAVYRHANMMRLSIASHGNDHRLGANEAPPSVISLFLGDTLTSIFEAIEGGKTFSANDASTLDLGADQLANLSRDNTDRNRTSPFAFTGNKFEFRAVGSSHAIGFPLSVLNAAVSEVFAESNKIIEEELGKGKKINEALLAVTKKWTNSAFKKIVFNGDGYSDEWLKEAEKRGLPNLRTTADALAVFKDEKATSFLTAQGIYRQSEINTRYNVWCERYAKHREIEYDTLSNMVDQYVAPGVVTYKKQLLEVIKGSKDAGVESRIEKEILSKLNFTFESLYQTHHNFKLKKDEIYGLPEDQAIKRIADELQPEAEKVAEFCNQLEEILPDALWPLPKLLDMLFLR